MEISEKDYNVMREELKKLDKENGELKQKIKQYENIMFAIESICKTSR